MASFTGRHAITGEEKPFFIEFFLCNPASGSEEAKFGQIGDTPSYLMVKAGFWGEDAAYLEQPTMPAFQPNDQYPKESIGNMTGTLVIKFKHPEDMGFDRKLIEENHFGTIVCGSVGVKKLFMHTEMAHLYKQTEDGPVLISRFWMGRLLKSKFLRKKIMTEKMVRGMAEYCCIEYRAPVHRPLS